MDAIASVAFAMDAKAEIRVRNRMFFNICKSIAFAMDAIASVAFAMDATADPLHMQCLKCMGLGCSRAAGDGN